MKKQQRDPDIPLVMAICTPLMARAHEKVVQAGEMAFIDATSTLDRCNTSVFILSASTPTSGIPLGVIVTSDERETTIYQGLQLLRSVLPTNAFCGRGAETGPKIVMTDDSQTERGAIAKFWPESVLFLCSFHFLQRRWTWLHDGKNRSQKDDRVTLIGLVKQLVYAYSEIELKRRYSEFCKNSVVLKYPRFLIQIKQLWGRQQEWAHCHRRTSFIRGNHTSNYAEAGMRVLKELIFSRVKAYNITQMFHFLTETMERYYQSKILSVAHSRIDRYVALRFQGLNSLAFPKETISQLDNGHFTVPSRTERGVVYCVDIEIGSCTCRAGIDGSPCSHQAAVAIHFGCHTVNAIPAMDPQGKATLAYIAYGRKSVKDLQFYQTLTGNQYAQQANHTLVNTFTNDDLSDTFSANDENEELMLDPCEGSLDDGPCNDPVPAREDSTDEADQSCAEDELCSTIDAIADDMKSRLTRDPVFRLSIEKFSTTYHKLTGKSNANAHLSTAWMVFWWQRHQNARRSSTKRQTYTNPSEICREKKKGFWKR
eukprot:m.208172 g.208172  ORF g.208172 m.208172 type:complete len:540 (+) comp39701_c1_seq9:1438-3057(+)